MSRINHQKIESIFNNYANGNLSDAKKQIATLNKLNLVFMLSHCHHFKSGLALLNNRAEQVKFEDFTLKALGY